ncbi:IclR family transcriptional regulator [Salinibacterium sp. ZJ450]|uniref:IclR family transcriptional regulator n=1 Tax=Salinibacterium sp. ZJ450 TaxID=2708338 RepID=UPI00141F2F3C|nr:IclR family transcriptional regulator [Salinibacterium sp. ZJ450]
MPRLTPAVLRTLDILELFLDGDEPLSAPDVVRLTGLPRTTVHELLSTLVARNYLQRDDATSTFRLGVRLLHLGNAYSARFDLLKAANEVAREASDRSGETVSVALRQGAEVFYLAKVESRDILRLPSSIGQRLPANATGLGKVLLAYLPTDQLHALFPDPENLPVMTERTIRTLPELERELAGVRERGVAFEREESTPNIRCAAAPVRGASGDVVAAISTSVPVPRWQQHPEQYWVDLVQDAAARLSAELGYAPARSADPSNLAG